MEGFAVKDRYLKKRSLKLRLAGGGSNGLKRQFIYTQLQTALLIRLKSQPNEVGSAKLNFSQLHTDTE